MLFAFWSPFKYVFVVPVELDLVEFAPRESEEELVFSDWGNIEDYCFFVSVPCGHSGLYLLGDFVECFSSDYLEEGTGTGKGRDVMIGDKLGVDEVSHRPGIYEGGTGDSVLLYADRDVKQLGTCR